MAALKERIRWLLAGSPLERPAKAVWNMVNRHTPSRYDQQTEEIIRTHSQSHWNCADVGANVGDISDLLLRYCPTGTHYLFEPIPANADLLRRKYRRSANVTIFDDALSDRAGTTTFHYNIAHPATSGIKEQRYFTKNNKIQLIEVKTARMDDKLLTAQVDLIKIDVEGAELLVLRGAKETIVRCKPLVVFEHSPYSAPYYGYGAEEMFGYFDDVGYGIYLLDDFLANRPPLARERFVKDSKEAREWYFVAKPIQ
ncbi:MAG TPA: FkbM family methyltransferase [Gammaproteobacteria bacterium]|nr:FkbM family methyltransferase [Gammaproteobacteria bacterium]